MAATRSSHIHRLRQWASTIFGGDFKQEWFCVGFNRNSLPQFQKLLGAKITSEGKTYHFLPPILYLNESPDKDALFLNPALAKVCNFTSKELLYSLLNYI